MSVTLLPLHKDVGPMIAGVAGVGYAETLTPFDVAWQPFASVVVTMYVPGELTEMLWVLDPGPSFHK